MLWGANMSRRPGWQTGARLNMLDTWRQRAHSVRGKGFACGHFIPEERPAETTAELTAFFDEQEKG